MRNRFQVVTVGKERGGKTFWAVQLAKKYVEKGKNSVIAYNFGKPSDFPDNEYTLIEPLTFDEHIRFVCKNKEEREGYKLNKEITHFWHNGRAVSFANFSRMFWGKKVKVYRIPNLLEERAFFVALYYYVSYCLLLLDDCKVSFRRGLNEGHIQLFSRKNHTGGKSASVNLRGGGMDIMTIWHNIDHVNTDIWDFSSLAVLFQFSMQPTFDKLNSPELEPVFLECHRKLLDMPKFSALQVVLQGERMGETSEATIKI